jgi:hypothetical protein
LQLAHLRRPHLWFFAASAACAVLLEIEQGAPSTGVLCLAVVRHALLPVLFNQAGCSSW